MSAVIRCGRSGFLHKHRVFGRKERIASGLVFGALGIVKHLADFQGKLFGKLRIVADNAFHCRCRRTRLPIS